MNDKEAIESIGGPFCSEEIDAGLIQTEAHVLTERERDTLWRLFEEIGRCWKNVFKSETDGKDVYDSSNLRSSWLEFIEAKTTQPPSYVAEYQNAVSVVEELIDLYGDGAFRRLFLESGINQSEPPQSRIAHAKRYVVDEFIRMQVIAGGFKAFGNNKNYAGYIGGSRYKLSPRVRAYRPNEEQV